MTQMTCVRCWKALPQYPRRKRLYCSPRCRRLAEYDRRKVARAAEHRAWLEQLGLTELADQMKEAT